MFGGGTTAPMSEPTTPAEPPVSGPTMPTMAAPASEEKKQSEDGGSVAAPALATAAPAPTAGVETESNGVDPML